MAQLEDKQMAQQQTYEGTPTQLAEQLRLLPESQKYRMTLTLEEAEEEEAESLEAAIARITNRTPEEIAAARERLFAATPPPRELPEGKTVLDVVMGTWPGDETDEQVFEALARLS
jgi:hypothetical protein